MLRHLNRKANEVVFMKCTEPACTVCAGKPWQAEKVYNFLKQRKFMIKLFRPEESTDHPGHYATFLELCQLPFSQVRDDDQNQPSVQVKQLERCNIWPSYIFSSNTEKKRHISVCHRRVKASVPFAGREKKKHVCTLANCGLTFNSYHKLYKQKKESGHRRAPGQLKKGTSRATIAQLLLQQQDENAEVDDERKDESKNEHEDKRDGDEDKDGAPDEDEDDDGVGDGEKHEDEDRDREKDRYEDEASGEEVIPNKRPLWAVTQCMGEKAKVLYDEGTKNENWWTGAVVDEVNEETLQSLLSRLSRSSRGFKRGV